MDNYGYILIEELNKIIHFSSIWREHLLGIHPSVRISHVSWNVVREVGVHLHDKRKIQLIRRPIIQLIISTDF